MPKVDTSIYSSHNSIIKFNKEAIKLKYKEDICSSAGDNIIVDNQFCSFKSFSGKFYIVWGTPQNNINFYDLEKEKIIKTILDAHNKDITSCRHYADLRHKIDYIITSSYDRAVKVWDLKTYTNIVNIQNSHLNEDIYSVSKYFIR